jgi:hypothetical protein
MIAECESPADLLKDVADLSFPAETEARMTELMDRNTEGLLSPTESDELAALVKWGHRISLLRARALLILGQKP